MALNNNNRLFTGILIGLGLAWVARNILPILAPLTRPLTKVSVKVAVLGYERSREVAAGMAETLSDVLAEVQHDLKTERAALGAAAANEPQPIAIEPARPPAANTKA